MKKAILILLTLSILSCSKTSQMAHKTTVFFNNELYSSTTHETTTEILPANPIDPNREVNTVKVTMTTGVGTGFVFIYYYTDKHSFSLIENAANQFRSTFTGDIDLIEGKLNGKAYDNKGNYMIFSENTSGGGSGLTQEQVEGLIFKA